MTSAVGHGGRVLLAFAWQGARTSTAYTTAYWMELLNAAVRVFAVVTVWAVLYRSYPQQFPVTGGQTKTYAAVTQLTAVMLTWWSGAHHRIARQVRDGTLYVDLLRPVSYPFQLLCWELGESAARLGLVVLPAGIPLFVLLGLGPPGSAAGGLLSAASTVLSFVLLYECNFLVGLVVFRTLSLKGVQHAYHALITLLSGLWIPLWLYPGPLAAISQVLPFRSIFYTPAAVYVGYLDGPAAVRACAVQLGWAVVLWLGLEAGWAGTRRALSAQGG